MAQAALPYFVVLFRSKYEMHLEQIPFHQLLDSMLSFLEENYAFIMFRLLYFFEQMSD